MSAVRSFAWAFLGAILLLLSAALVVAVSVAIAVQVLR
jgi:uncharacterized membrane protein